MSDIHKPSGEQSMVVFHNQSKHIYQITAKYNNFQQRIVYRSDKTEEELMRWFLSDIRHGNPCLVQNVSDKYPVVLNLNSANVIEITKLED